ncbi:hypothetical protein [Sinisalibacter aestuarii]|uniref:Transcriptional regulator n=1 Tax=Sinisalibacter aestuarii TaxID=2949426 RepID=A0ABQ5M0R9_9RHOB|nr:hypothetical protein [Sinisalibacter aestuarii]GKY90232.1 hypothetical protein STA1M1_41010 [Sinisalibacter aestuarii]
MKYCFARAAFRGIVLALGLFVLPAFAGARAADLTLVMVEQPGCVWCARWNAEIAPAYPKTAEGAAAPLTRIDLHEPVPEHMSFTRPAQFTPTFVLLADGAEVGRIEGYPGDDFFWPMLGQLLARAGVAIEN